MYVFSVPTNIWLLLSVRAQYYRKIKFVLGLPNDCNLVNEDGTTKNVPKATRVAFSKGKKILLQCGGGGGYGNPENRDKEKILDDFKQEYISKEYIEKYYPKVLKAIE